MFETPKVTAPDAYIRKSQLLRTGYVPFSAATLWRRVKDGSFPAPVKLSTRVTAWKVRDILEWQRAQVETGCAPVK